MARSAFIMAGGSGERFWPLSRLRRPKQLLRLTDPKLTLLEEAARRIEPLLGAGHVYVITGRHLEGPIRQAAVVPPENVWAEPAKKNTLGALAWVAANLMAQGRASETLAILTADHKIADAEKFRQTVKLAMECAEQTQGLVTCGIVPTRPETGYGYVELDPSQPMQGGAARAAGFREKPDAETAQHFVESGRFLWNSGMFFWTVQAFLRELNHANPAAHEFTVEMANALSAGEPDLAEDLFLRLPSASIDFALMEKAESVFVVRGEFGWDDVGAWDALPRSLESDPNGNVFQGDCVVIDCANVVVYNENPSQTIAMVGVNDMVVVQTEDALLICPMDQAQRVKEIVERLKESNAELL